MRDQSPRREGSRSGGEVFPNLDLVKLAMAVVVVAIHTRPLDDLGSAAASQVFSTLSGVAVPFFFISSGFLCFKGHPPVPGGNAGNSASMTRLKGTIVKLLRLYLIWTAMYLPVTMLGNELFDRDLLSSALLFIRGFLLVGENFCSWPLWYLHASVVAFTMIYLLVSKGLPWGGVLAVSAGLMAVGFLISVAYGWEEAPWLLESALDIYYLAFGNVRNGFFEGFFYVSLGMAAALSERVLRIGRKWLVLGLFVGGLGCVFVTSDAHLPPCALCSFCLFLLAAGKSGPGLAPHRFARSASTVVYFTHMLFAVFLVYVLLDGTEYPFSANGVCGTAVFFFALACSLGLSVVVYRARRFPAVRAIFGV